MGQQMHGCMGIRAACMLGLRGRRQASIPGVMSFFFLRDS